MATLAGAMELLDKLIDTWDWDENFDRSKWFEPIQVDDGMGGFL